MKEKKFKKVLIYLFIIIIIIIINVPFFSMIQKAFTPDKVLIEYKSSLLGKLKMDNFIVVLTGTEYGKTIINSIIVSFFATIICIIISSLLGYALSRFRGRVFNIYSLLLFILQMFPLILLLIPLFIIFKHFHLINTLFSIIISYIAIALPFSAMMLKSFFDTIPFEIEESALIDGCNRFGTYFRIILPISLPGLATVGIFVFIFAWGEYMLASIMVTTKVSRTLTVGLQLFRQQYVTSWGDLMAASFLATIPSFLFLLFAQRYLISGLASSAVKG